MMTDEEFDEMFVKAGIRPSPVRKLVVRELANAHWPISTQDIETALDTVDRSSITRTLAIFSEHGLVHAVEDGSGSVKYELCRFHSTNDSDSDPDLHPHFHCISCGTTYCLNDHSIPSIPLPDGFLQLSANFVIKGICSKCRSKECIRS